MSGNLQVPLFKVFMADEASSAVARVLSSGFIGQGPNVDAFETALGTYFDTENTLTLNSATSALTIALRLITDELGRGEVLSTPLTCTATNWAILANQQRIRWVDVDSATGNMDLDDLARKLSPESRAIMVVHWGGYPNDLDRLAAIQSEYQRRYGRDLPIVEDCSHACGSAFNGKKLGNHGNYCVYSLQAIKHVTSGDGGVLITPTKAAHDLAKLLRWYGIDRTRSTHFRCEGDIPAWGYKFHMNDINAVIGMANLRHADWIVSRHQENAAFYRDALSDVSGIQLMRQNADRTSASWIFTIRVERRDDLERKLASHGVMANRVHERNDKHSCVESFRTSLPGMDVMQHEMTCIPVGWWVDQDARQRIVELIRQGW